VNSDPTSLDRLHDIVTPPPVPLWPPAPGWYFVLGFLVVLVVVLAFRGFIRWQRNCYRREALAEVARLEMRLPDPAARACALGAMGELLKRAAITAFTRARVASLSGPPWFAFLDRTGRTAAFGKGAGAKLEAATYDPRGAGAFDEDTAQGVAQQVRHWLKTHRVAADGDRSP